MVGIGLFLWEGEGYNEGDGYIQIKEEQSMNILVFPWLKEHQCQPG